VKIGTPAQLHCIGHVPEPKCSVSDKRLDFGTIAAGLSKEKKILLTHEHVSAPTAFHAEIEPRMAGITITPSVKVLLPSETVALSVKLEIHRAVHIEK
jgi:hypothetical protein